MVAIISPSRVLPWPVGTMSSARPARGDRMKKVKSKAGDSIQPSRMEPALIADPSAAPTDMAVSIRRTDLAAHCPSKSPTREVRLRPSFRYSPRIVSSAPPDWKRWALAPQRNKGGRHGTPEGNRHVGAVQTIPCRPRSGRDCAEHVVPNAENLGVIAGVVFKVRRVVDGVERGAHHDRIEPTKSPVQIGVLQPLEHKLHGEHRRPVPCWQPEHHERHEQHDI